MDVTPVIPHYPNDSAALASFSAEKRWAFDKFMTELDAEHDRLGRPYGNESLWMLTGASCWIDYFEEKKTAAETLCEDLSNADYE